MAVDISIVTELTKGCSATGKENTTDRRSVKF